MTSRVAAGLAAVLVLATGLACNGSASHKRCVVEGATTVDSQHQTWRCVHPADDKSRPLEWQRVPK